MNKQKINKDKRVGNLISKAIISAYELGKLDLKQEEQERIYELKLTAYNSGYNETYGNFHEVVLVCYGVIVGVVLVGGLALILGI